MSTMDYRPGARVLGRLKSVDFVAVVGPTAVGKTTLIKAAIAADPRLHMLIGGTSRDPRPGERDGVDFHFEDLPATRARIGRREYVTVAFGASGDFYTTAPEDYPTGKVVMLATLAEAVPMFRGLPFRSFRTIFVLPPSREAWHERMQLHKFTQEQLEKRFKEAKVSLHFALEDKQTQFVISSNLDVATEDCLTLAQGKSMSKHLQVDQSRARTLVRNLLNSFEQELFL